LGLSDAAGTVPNLVAEPVAGAALGGVS